MFAVFILNFGAITIDLVAAVLTSKPDSSVFNVVVVSSGLNLVWLVLSNIDKLISLYTFVLTAAGRIHMKLYFYIYVLLLLVQDKWIDNTAKRVSTGMVLMLFSGIALTMGAESLHQMGIEQNPKEKTSPALLRLAFAGIIIDGIVLLVNLCLFYIDQKAIDLEEEKEKAKLRREMVEFQTKEKAKLRREMVEFQTTRQTSHQLIEEIEAHALALLETLHEAEAIKKEDRCKIASLKGKIAHLKAEIASRTVRTFTHPAANSDSSSESVPEGHSPLRISEPTQHGHP